MAGSLKDQLLNMGLVDQKKAKQADTEKRKKKKQANKARKSGQTVVNEQALKQQELEKQRKEKQEHDRELNRQRDEERRNREIEAQCRQMITQQKLNIPENAEVSHNFAYDKKVKTLYVTEELQGQIIRGQVAIAVLDEKFYLIPDKFAEKIEQRHPDFVIRVQPEEEPEEDDPYADYKIPDDLMW
ncbi:DUF2058 domain-containing protein [Neptuniibacter sp.]|uniref:DUF2058 domain-containing protein n=1 Tax=Neptuniibacter sp. TaxID=1962643 RepID=UPI002618C425|nr:DUF2058 domain-containing protein [Neptuniibacter sp.]MCP4597863.1 DUF2058 domain-containing protein [Neptuniibacter sp.]